MKKLTFLILCALFAFGAIGCQSSAAIEDDLSHAENQASARDNGHSEGIVLTAEAAKIAGIEVGVASRVSMQGELKVPGTITTVGQGRAIVTSPVGGKVSHISVRVGDQVRAGQTIVTIDSAELAQASSDVVGAQRNVLAAQATAREAKSEIDLAKARLRNAQQVLTRQQDFAKAGAFSQPALQAAQRELSEAQAELERSKQEQTIHQTQLERAERLFQQQLISRTELEQARLEVEEDRIQQRTAQQRIEIAKAATKREEDIAAGGLSNSREIQAAESEVRAANLEVQRAKIRYDAAVAGVAGANKGLMAAKALYSSQAGGNSASGGQVGVRTPIAGSVADLAITLGQAVERTTEICEVHSLSSVWVTANVPEKDIAKVARGRNASVTVSSYPGRIFNGVVQVVSSKLDPKTRTMPVQVLVSNADGALKPEMFATVAIGVGSRGLALAVPRTAIVEEGDRHHVYVAEDGGRYEEVAVKVGRVQGDNIEIIGGLEPGARVVTKGAIVLKSEKVKSELKGHEH